MPSQQNDNHQCTCKNYLLLNNFFSKIDYLQFKILNRKLNISVKCAIDIEFLFFMCLFDVDESVFMFLFVSDLCVTNRIFTNWWLYSRSVIAWKHVARWETTCCAESLKKSSTKCDCGGTEVTHVSSTCASSSCQSVLHINDLQCSNSYLFYLFFYLGFLYSNSIQIKWEY